MSARRSRARLPVVLLRALLLMFVITMAAAAFFAFGVLSLMLGH